MSETLSSLPLLSVNKLHISTTNQMTLVDELSFELYRGQTLAIVGESGSGKSLSSLALMGLLPSNLTVSGQAQISDFVLPLAQSIHNGKAKQKKRERYFNGVRGNKIGMIFQEPMTALNPLHTVGKQIGESLRLAGIAKRDHAEHILQLLNDVNIKDPINKLNRYPHELSGGQRQRVMIAMALARKPEVLIADEPTTALDVTLQHDILALLSNLKNRYGMAMILISHDLNLVKQYSDSVIVMQSGKTIEQGDTQTLFNHPAHDYTKALIHQDFGEPLRFDEKLDNNLEDLRRELKSESEKPSIDKDSPCSASHQTSPEGLNFAVVVHDLSVAYPVKRSFFGMTKQWTTVVESVTFCLLQGYSLGIVGESGSGKTTIAMAMTRLLSNQAKVIGDIKIAGQDMLILSHSELRRFRANIQLVFQDPFASINPRFTVMQIVEEGLLVQGVAKAERERAVFEALQTVHLPTDFSNCYAHELSGGQRQRVALARALVMKPKVMILDEPTSALDSTTQVAVVELLRDIQAEFGISYVFISHDLKVVKAVCQQVLVLQNGQVVEQGLSQDIFEQPKHDYTRRLVEAIADT